MPLSIKNAEAERFARELAHETGESLTTTVTRALEERLVRVRGRRWAKDCRRQALEIVARCAWLPDLDTRTPDEILGYGGGRALREDGEAFGELETLGDGDGFGDVDGFRDGDALLEGGTRR